MKRNFYAKPLRRWKFFFKLIGIKNAFNFYFPFLGAGIKIHSINKDLTSITTQLKLNFFNPNYMGIHFGGSLFSMCDPFYVFILFNHLPKQYFIIDKKATIEFLLPTKKKVYATLSITHEEINTIKERCEQKKKIDWEVETFIFDEDNKKIAKINKILYIRKLKNV